LKVFTLVRGPVGEGFYGKGREPSALKYGTRGESSTICELFLLQGREAFGDLSGKQKSLFDL